MSERFIAFLRSPARLAGRCPACEEPMDESGCRIAAHWHVKAAARRRTGIAQVVEVFCNRTPTGEIVECPACR